MIKAVLALSVVLPNIACAADWYDSAGSTCSGPTSLNAGIDTYFSRSLSLAAIPPAGNFAILLTPREVTEIGSGQPYKLNEIAIDRQKAESLRVLFKAESENQVPLLAKVTYSFLLNYTLVNVAANVAAGVLFDYFYQNVDAEPISIKNVAGYIAAGGRLDHSLSVRKSANGNRFILSQTSYVVNIGEETRSFILGACQFPIKLQVSEFQTAGQFNNKLVKPLSDGKWGVFDLTDNKWDSEKLSFSRQDVEYIEFQSDEIEYNSVVGKTIHRISLYGGAWARKKSTSDTFSNLYLNVTAK